MSQPMRNCTSCNSSVWKKTKEGSWVCRFGHAYEMQEEVVEMEYNGAATRSISLKSSRKSSKKSTSKKSDRIKRVLQPEYAYLQFQCCLKDQVTWLIQNRSDQYPAEFGEMARDLWLFWLQNALKSPFARENDEPIVQYKYGFVHSYFTLIFIHITAFKLKLGVTYPELAQLCFTSTFPYFSPVSVERFHNSDEGGYDSLPSLHRFHREQSVIMNVLYRSGWSCTFTLDQPILVYRLLKHLDLPAECYLYYKTISSFVGTKKIIDKLPYLAHLHVGLICLWIARVYHSGVKIFDALDQDCLLWYILPSSENGSFRNTKVIPQLKRATDKVAVSLFKEYVVGETLINELPQSQFDEIVDLDTFIKPVHSESIEIPQPQPAKEAVEEAGLDDYPQIENTSLFKSYMGADPDGLKDVTFATLLIKTASLVGIDHHKLQSELEILDKLLSNYSQSLNK